MSIVILALWLPWVHIFSLNFLILENVVFLPQSSGMYMHAHVNVHVTRYLCLPSHQLLHWNATEGNVGTSVGACGYTRVVGSGLPQLLTCYANGQEEVVEVSMCAYQLLRDPYIGLSILVLCVPCHMHVHV